MLSTVAFLILVKSLLSASPPQACSSAEWKSDPNETCKYQSLLQIGTNVDTGLNHSFNDGMPRVASRTHKAQGDILYVVRTWHKNYDTRLPSIIDTWGSALDSSSLLIVGDKDLHNPTVYAATGCSSDHQVGLTCKTGHSLALAAEKIGSRSWAFVIDDDVYVNTSNLEGLLKQHDASRLVALGIPGCGAPHCDDHQGGFCGGGGYALSSAALKALVDKKSPMDFHNELRDMTKVFYPGGETPWDDITTTCLMKRRGITVEHIDGLYGWRIPGDSKAAPDGKLSPTYKRAIHSSSPLPLTFHYITPKEMYTIHDQFMKPTPEKVSLLQEVSAGPSYAEQLRQYIQQENLKRSHA